MNAVVVTALSSNATVVDAGGMAVTGTGASRTLTITPVANASGTTTITVSAVDAGTPPLAVQQTFLLTVTAVNDPPVVSPVGPQSTPEDTPLLVDVAYSDVDTALTSPPFSITATSSNTALVPNANLSLAGNGSPRTLTITPVADQTGTTTITVTASDGSVSSAPVSFALTVTGVNDPPIVSPIADQTTAEDTPKVVSVNYDDPDTPLASVGFTLTSSNTTLVPNGSLVLTGSGSPRTLTITPAANQSGTTVVTVTANDGTSSSAPVSFDLVVSPANDPPTLNPIGPQSTSEDTVKSVPLALGDPDAADILTVTATSSVPSVVADAGLAVTGSGTSRTLVITPVANTSGATTITVTVTDNGTPQGSVQQSFVLTVNPANDAPSISGIGPQTVNEDTATGALGFTVGDVETDPGSLVVTASSDNPTLVPERQHRAGRERRESHGDRDARGERVGDGDDHADGGRPQRPGGHGVDLVPADRYRGERPADDLEHRRPRRPARACRRRPFRSPWRTSRRGRRVTVGATLSGTREHPAEPGRSRLAERRNPLASRCRSPVSGADRASHHHGDGE